MKHGDVMSSVCPEDDYSHDKLYIYLEFNGSSHFYHRKLRLQLNGQNREDGAVLWVQTNSVFMTESTN